MAGKTDVDSPISNAIDVEVMRRSGNPERVEQLQQAVQSLQDRLPYGISSIGGFTPWTNEIQVGEPMHSIVQKIMTQPSGFGLVVNTTIPSASTNKGPKTAQSSKDESK